MTEAFKPTWSMLINILTNSQQTNKDGWMDGHSFVHCSWSLFKAGKQGSIVLVFAYTK